jgi:hypothetical protein
MAVKNIGTHVTHCCLRHGCKYSEAECPVETKTHEQEFACPYCTSSATLEARIKETEEELEWSRSLEAKGIRIFGYDD